MHRKLQELNDDDDVEEDEDDDDEEQPETKRQRFLKTSEDSISEEQDSDVD